MTLEAKVSCTRCGNYCERLVPAYKVCEPCLGFVLPLGMRGETNLGSIARGVEHVLRSVGLPSVLLLGMANVPNGAVVVLRSHEETQALSALGLFWSPVPFVVGLVVMVLAHQAIRGEPISVRGAARHAASRLVTVFWTNVVSAFFVMLWSLLLVLPGLHKSLCYCLAPHIALFESRAGDDAVAHSMLRTQPMLGTVYLLGIGAMLLSAFLHESAAGVAQIIGATLTGATAITHPAFFALAAATATVASTLMSLLTLTTLQVLYEQSTIRAADMGLLSDEDA